METGNQGDQWLSTSVDLSAYVGQVIKLRYIGQTAHGWQGDMAIDNVCVDEAMIPAPPVSFTQFEIEEIEENFTKLYDGEDLQESEFGEMVTTIYPNPVAKSGTLMVEISDITSTSKFVQISIRDLIGREVVFTQIGTYGTSMFEVIELPEGISTGAYMITINDGVNQVTERVIITE